MSVFLRRFTSDPGSDVLLDIESVNIIDLEPQASITGVGTGVAMLVGEFENGPFNEPTQLAGLSDFISTFGGLGYTYNGVVGQNPCARSRKADGAVTPEYWNGNGFVQLNGKRFSSLLCVRVDTSVGAVSFDRQAMVTGGAAFAYNLEPAQVLSLDIGSGYTSATFSAAAAVLTSAAGTYPSTFAGGETLTLGYDDKPDFTVTFLAADQSMVQVIARINAAAGFTFAASASPTTFTLTSPGRGTGARVRVIAASGAGVLTTLGLTVTSASGTGNVANIDAVTYLEVKRVVEAAVAGTKVEQDSAGRLRISKTYVAVGDYIAVGPATTATALGFVIGKHNSNDGYARLRSSAGTYPSTFAGGETMTIQVDDELPVVVTFALGDQSQAQVIAKINSAMGYTCASSVSATVMLLTGRKNGGHVTVTGVSAALVTTATGYAAGASITSDAVLAGSLPAGTLVTNAAGTASFVTMRDVAVSTATVGTYSARVRHALDDGTGTSATAGTLTALAAAPDVGSFAVTNPALVQAALSEAAIDAQYAAAFDATLDISSIARTANLVWSARQSNAARRAGRTNALVASASGLRGRIFFGRPPLGTTRTAAKSNVAEPGVGATRDERFVYCYPGVSTFVPQIALRGTGGGAGFTADGLVDVGWDGFLVSICSQLPPEEDPGQQTAYTTAVIGLESSSNAKGFTIDDYKAFKAAGICAPRMDDGVAIAQSGITSVDPLVHPNLTDINRRRMADYIEDSLALRAKSYGKKTQTFARRIAIANEQVGFLEGLLSRNNPQSQRIESYSVDRKSGNTPDLQGQGLFRLLIKVRTLSSFKSIVLQSTIGPTVTVDEVAA